MARAPAFACLLRKARGGHWLDDVERRQLLELADWQLDYTALRECCRGARKALPRLPHVKEGALGFFVVSVRSLEYLMGFDLWLDCVLMRCVYSHDEILREAQGRASEGVAETPRRVAERRGAPRAAMVPCLPPHRCRLARPSFGKGSSAAGCSRRRGECLYLMKRICAFLLLHETHQATFCRKRT